MKKLKISNRSMTPSERVRAPSLICFRVRGTNTRASGQEKDFVSRSTVPKERL